MQPENDARLQLRLHAFAQQTLGFQPLFNFVTIEIDIETGVGIPPSPPGCLSLSLPMPLSFLKTQLHGYKRRKPLFLHGKTCNNGGLHGTLATSGQGRGPWHFSHRPLPRLEASCGLPADERHERDARALGDDPSEPAGRGWLRGSRGAANG